MTTCLVTQIRYTPDSPPAKDVASLPVSHETQAFARFRYEFSLVGIGTVNSDQAYAEDPNLVFHSLCAFFCLSQSFVSFLS